MPKRKSWSFSTGERGRNRVRAFAHPATGLLFLEFTDCDAVTGARARLRVALSHRDTNRAKAAAETLAGRLRTASPAREAVLTVGALIDSYERAVTPRKAPTTQGHDRRAFTLFRESFGAHSPVRGLDRRDWDTFIADRRSGRLRPIPKSKGKAKKDRPAQPVRDAIVGQDLRLFLAMVHWAMKVRRPDGEPVLDRNPFAGLPIPREISPVRARLSSEELGQLYAVAEDVSPTFALLLAVAHQTGHRVGAICQLRWSDIDLEAGRILWRAENDKIGYEHTTPIDPELSTVLKSAQRRSGSIGASWVFPAVTGEGPLSRWVAYSWWKRAIKAAKLARVHGRGWHSLRRLFATELRHETPLKDLCQLGGWKCAQTVLTCYQAADEDTMRKALEQRASRTLSATA